MKRVRRNAAEPTSGRSSSSRSSSGIPILDGRIVLVGDAARAYARDSRLASMLEHIGAIYRAANPTQGLDGAVRILATPEGLPIVWPTSRILAAKKNAERGKPIKWNVTDLNSGRTMSVEAPMHREPRAPTRPRGAPRRVTPEEWRAYLAGADRPRSLAQHADRLTKQLGKKVSPSTIRRLLNR